MKIEIRGNGAAVIITFDTQAKKFDSDYERNKFFRELHGWKQTVPSNGKRYEYRRPGLLDEIPHIRVADSAFIVAMEHMKRMEKFFKEWEDKVEYDMMKIMMQDHTLLRKLFEARIEGQNGR
jgi:hypothetical protein